MSQAQNTGAVGQFLGHPTSGIVANLQYPLEIQVNVAAILAACPLLLPTVQLFLSAVGEELVPHTRADPSARIGGPTQTDVASIATQHHVEAAHAGIHLISYASLLKLSAKTLGQVIVSLWEKLAQPQGMAMLGSLVHCQLQKRQLIRSRAANVWETTFARIKTPARAVFSVLRGMAGVGSPPLVFALFMDSADQVTVIADISMMFPIRTFAAILRIRPNLDAAKSWMA
eukprot:TRINITY_DN48803_c0_g1_i1.p2 TRINITY_DN48803_c0_g1~~TRINITY_DN48803_c0_g1_i1.p2  ORF type:complete len:229 (+),score=10.79 TRINITY_DN48803_c0_g1_i1:218-904(+)